MNTILDSFIGCSLAIALAFGISWAVCSLKDQNRVIRDMRDKLDQQNK